MSDKDKPSYEDIKKAILLGRYDLVTKEDIIGTPLENIISIKHLERCKQGLAFKLAELTDKQIEILNVAAGKL